MGAAMLFRKTAVAAITAVGALMTGLTIGLFVPNLFLAHGVSQRVTAINFVADTLLFAGMMFAIAREVGAQSWVDVDGPLSGRGLESPGFQTARRLN